MDKKRSTLQLLVTNSIVAALYVAVTFLVISFAFTDMQFRLSEMLNHLVVFNPNFFWGIVGGVFISNMWSSLGPIDMLFGTLHTALALGVTILIGKFVKNRLALMWINTFVFTFSMFIISFQITWIGEFPLKAFFITWGLLAISEFVVMALGIPVISWIAKRLPFDKAFDPSFMKQR